MQDWRDQAGIGAMRLSESFIAPLVPWEHLLSHVLPLGCGIKTESDRSLLASIKKKMAFRRQGCQHLMDHEHREKGTKENGVCMQFLSKPFPSL